MANLEQLRQKVKNITDYSPELQQFNNQLDDLINDAYYCIWTMKRWNFATKLSVLRFHVDITKNTDLGNAAAGVTEVKAVVNQSQRQVVFDTSIDRLIFYKDQWEGQPIEIDNMEYTINKVISGTTILLDRSFEGPTSTKNIGWRIKKRWYDLPKDCLELLYLGHRDYPYVSATGSQNPYGKSTAILPRREEELNLRTDYEMGYAEAYIPSPAKLTRPGENLSIAETEIAGANLASGTHYEICYAFVKDGKVGALSDSAIHKLSGNNKGLTVTFTSWNNDPIFAETFNHTWQIPDEWEGHRKVLFWNQNFDPATGERKGLPCWTALVNGLNNTSSAVNDQNYIRPVNVEDTSSTYVIKQTSQFNNKALRYIEIDGQHQQVRPYPRVNGFDYSLNQIKDANNQLLQPEDFVREGVIRYMVKPIPLCIKTDVPNMPYEFHQLIVYKALEDIYLKLGQQGLATTYERKYQKEVSQLAKRYVDKIDLRVQRGQFQLGQAPAVFDGSTLRRIT
jgi:hypothetical protein